MAYNINKDIFNRINLERGIYLLKKHGITYSGYTKEALFSKINDAVNGKIENKVLPIEVVNQFVIDEISHGKNRKLYISNMDYKSIQKMKDINFIKDALEANGYEKEPFNKLQSVNCPDEYEISYWDYKLSNQYIKSVSFCFAYSAEEDNNNILSKFTDFIWCNIFPQEGEVIIKIWAKNNTNLSEKSIYHDILAILENIFLIQFKNTSGKKQVLYKIFKELTDKASEPFREKIEPIKNNIKTFSECCLEKLGTTSNRVHVDIAYRIERLFERAIIQADFQQYEAPTEGKLGYISRVSFSDDTGANVQAKAAIDRELQMADIFFDTRDTLDEIKNINKLWIVWFYRYYDSNQDRKVEKVDTKIEVFDYYYIINFTRQYTIKEEEECVLSNFREFETK